MLGDWLAHAGKHGQHAIGLMIRRERTQLVETIERSRAIYGPLGFKWREQEKMWTAPNGARLRFAYLERDADADGYQGHGYTRLYVEEATTFPDAAPILKLMATLRSGAGVPVGMRLTGNPGGSGHQWVKARYIDPAPGGWTIVTDPATGLQRVYIPSRVGDNAYLGADYVQRLKASGSPALVKAWLDGDWSVVEGAYFPEWSTERHVVPPFTIPDGWARFRSMDWGSSSPFSVGWWAVASDEYRIAGKIIPRGALVRYREWYGASAPNVGLKLTAEEVARGIKEREKGDKVTSGVLDPAAFARDGGPSIAERMATQGVSFRPADNARVAGRGAMGGWDLLRARLKGDGERPMLVVFDTCRDLIRTLPALQHDRNRAEDVDTDGEDHAADECRYACMSRPWTAPRPAAPKPKGDGYRVRALPDAADALTI